MEGALFDTLPKLIIGLIQTALLYLLVQLDGFANFIMTGWEISCLCPGCLWTFIFIIWTSVSAERSL